MAREGDDEMKKTLRRDQIIARLRDTIGTGKPIIGAGNYLKSYTASS